VGTGHSKPSSLTFLTLSRLSDSLFILLYSYLDILSIIEIMAGIFARRSALRAVTTAQSFRTAPRAGRSAQLLGRRLYSSGKNDKGYEEHATSDLPWYALSYLRIGLRRLCLGEFYRLSTDPLTDFFLVMQVTWLRWSEWSNDLLAAASGSGKEASW
jgi:hypothetical protein